MFTFAPAEPFSFSSHSMCLKQLGLSCIKPYLVAALPTNLLYNSCFTVEATGVVGLRWVITFTLEEVMRSHLSHFQIADAVSSSPCFDVSDCISLILSEVIASIEIHNNILELVGWEMAGNIVCIRSTIVSVIIGMYVICFCLPGVCCS